MLERTRSQCMSTCKWTNEEIDEAVQNLNSIMFGIEHGAYYEGNRNNVAVDLAICFFIMGIEDDDQIIYILEKECGFTDKQKQSDLHDRLETINKYLQLWATSDILSYMVGWWHAPKKIYIKVVD